MSKPTLQIIIASTRALRVGSPVAEWIKRCAERHGGTGRHLPLRDARVQLRLDRPLENALDHIHVEWQYKVAGSVSYGGVAAGTSAAQMITQVITTLTTVPLFEAVSIPFVTQCIDNEGRIAPNETMEVSATAMLDELVRVTAAIRPLRQLDQEAEASNFHADGLHAATSPLAELPVDSHTVGLERAGEVWATCAASLTASNFAAVLFGGATAQPGGGTMKSARALAFAPVAGLVLLAGCSSSAPAAAPPAYQHRGPGAVGVTTLDLGSAGPVFGERLATVYYPADPGTVAGHAKFSYTEASTLPASLQGIVPAKYNTTTTVDAYADAPASKKGPYPIVLFSHGDGGGRLYYSTLLTGIASWGYVVVSADYLERGLAAQALGSKTKPTAALDSSIMQSSLTATERASSQSTSVLHGVADSQRVAAAGHSTGGGTAFDALGSPKVSTAIGWAPVGPVGTPSKKPVMLIGAEGDDVVPPAFVKRTYDSFTGPKALVEISGEGHNTYTDICAGIRSGGGLISYAVASHLVTPELAKFGINGCQKTDVAPQRFWPIVQFYTVLQLKNQFDGSGQATIPAPATGQFPGFTVTVQQAN